MGCSIGDGPAGRGAGWSASPTVSPHAVEVATSNAHPPPVSAPLYRYGDQASKANQAGVGNPGRSWRSVVRVGRSAAPPLLVVVHVLGPADDQGRQTTFRCQHLPVRLLVSHPLHRREPVLALRP